ncbi:hypothetical protein V202x_11910 [Gimesia aquarii]|uniref:Uncharacterized protein n=1 Tax=Gimesia aquarii TaxID=2527964 RepID=A0A517WRE4_9PLAN|nr:hypothetical protein V202x_11910 [Gimesia aquarii]
MDMKSTFIRITFLVTNETIQTNDRPDSQELSIQFYAMRET